MRDKAVQQSCIISPKDIHANPWYFFAQFLCKNILFWGESPVEDKNS